MNTLQERLATARLRDLHEYAAAVGDERFARFTVADIGVHIDVPSRHPLYVNVYRNELDDFCSLCATCPIDKEGEELTP